MSADQDVREVIGLKNRTGNLGIGAPDSLACLSSVYIIYPLQERKGRIKGGVYYEDGGLREW